MTRAGAERRASRRRGGALYTARPPRPRRQNTHTRRIKRRHVGGPDAYKRVRVHAAPRSALRAAARTNPHGAMGLFKLLRYAYGNRLVKHDAITTPPGVMTPIAVDLWNVMYTLLERFCGDAPSGVGDAAATARCFPLAAADAAQALLLPDLRRGPRHPRGPARHAGRQGHRGADHARRRRLRPPRAARQRRLHLGGRGAGRVRVPCPARGRGGWR
ncbi:UL41 virion host shutoff factor [Bovine alphaherpesvirus 5]|nr:UL41 virion host shutoff factor [Bovine alphaherpesvirus 5]